MEAAKEAINKLTSSHGHHTTEVHEHYNPAITHEQVNPTREHENTTVVDREVHQDHHHTSVLPIKHKEVLPTEHSHNVAAAKHTEHHHGDHEGIRSKVEAEAQRFKDETQTAATEKTHTTAPTIGSEHHHHHVHETIQPVIQKQTIQPSVVHTTIPVHEVHHSEPKHYTASALPAVSMQEFKAQGGSLTGLSDRVEKFEGEPQNIAKHGLHGHHGAGSTTTGTSASHGVSDATQTGTHSTGLTDGSRSGGIGQTTGLDNTNRSSATAQTGSTLNNPTHSGTTGVGSGAGGELSRAQQAIDSRVDKPGHAGVGSTAGSGTGTTGASSASATGLSNTTSSTSSNSKPSLIDRINPFKDADGDGKKGVGS